LEDKQTHGSIVTTDSDKRQLARYSITYNYEKNTHFKKHFPELLDRENLEKARQSSLQPVKGSPPPGGRPGLHIDRTIAGNTSDNKREQGGSKATNEKGSKREKNTLWVILIFSLLLAATLNQIL
jgi:hypothetical protein